MLLWFPLTWAGQSAAGGSEHLIWICGEGGKQMEMESEALVPVLYANILMKGATDHSYGKYKGKF